MNEPPAQVTSRTRRLPRRPGPCLPSLCVTEIPLRDRALPAWTSLRGQANSASRAGKRRLWAGEAGPIRLAASGTALPPCLEKADARGHGHVETFHAAVHRDARQFIAGLAGQAAHAVAFGTEYPGARNFLSMA